MSKANVSCNAKLELGDLGNAGLQAEAKTIFQHTRPRVVECGDRTEGRVGHMENERKPKSIEHNDS